VSSGVRRFIFTRSMKPPESLASRESRQLDAREVLRLGLAPFLAPEPDQGGFIGQLGRATEELNLSGQSKIILIRSWYQRNTGRQVRDVQPSQGS
jgi:hypothetical protein